MFHGPQLPARDVSQLHKAMAEISRADPGTAYRPARGAGGCHLQGVTESDREWHAELRRRAVKRLGRCPAMRRGRSGYAAPALQGPDGALYGDPGYGAGPAGPRAAAPAGLGRGSSLGRLLGLAHGAE